jgi:hypothetical protein
LAGGTMKKPFCVVAAAPSIARIILGLLFVTAPSFSANHIWAKKGVSFPARCFSDAIRECQPVRIPSPDRQSFVEVRYRKVSFDDGGYVLDAFLKIIGKDGRRGEVGPTGLVEAEVLWSPDSTSFLVNGSDGGEGPDRVFVYRLSDPEFYGSDIISAAQKDMVVSFPPCKAKDADPRCCASLTIHPEEINVAAVDWTRGSAAIVVMGEMPCSSRFGGIMCQVQGYEVGIPSGKILRRMNPKEFATRWQHSMAWKFHDPGPPEYQDQ